MRAKERSQYVAKYLTHTCRCHVMERESFESEAVAKVLNKNFVSIKVSRVG